jgi:hypothetical protein
VSDRAGDVVDKKSTIFPRKVRDRPASSPFSFFALHINHKAVFSSGKEEAIFFDEFSIPNIYGNHGILSAQPHHTFTKLSLSLGDSGSHGPFFLMKLLIKVGSGLFPNPLSTPTRPLVEGPFDQTGPPFDCPSTEQPLLYVVTVVQGR